MQLNPGGAIQDHLNQVAYFSDPRAFWWQWPFSQICGLARMMNSSDSVTNAALPGVRPQNRASR